MFHYRLAILIIVTFSFVVFLAIALFLGANQVAGYFQRSHSAYQAFDEYQHLSQAAYQHFKLHMDSLIKNLPVADAEQLKSKNTLSAAMDKLRDTIVKPENTMPDGENGIHKRAEMERLAYLTAFLEASEYRFEEIDRLRLQGNRELAMRALSRFSEDEIGGKFEPLIAKAINAERDKAKKSELELAALVTKSRWIAILTALTATVFSFVLGILMLRGVRKPIAALLRGTDEIATGNLDYRIELANSDEFGYLARHFNQMAEELGHQQQKLRDGRALLENKVLERTSELHELNEALKRMDVARREFLADISHELRTPITVIRGEAEVSLRGKLRDAEDYRETLQRIVELSRQLGKYVNDLMFLARAETANLQFEWERLDFGQLVANSLEDYQVMAEENGLSVTLTADEQPIWVRGDKHRLRQILFILGDNACRYSHPGGKIHLSIWQSADMAYFKLTDQGIGIPQHDLENIFDRQFRSKNAQISRQDGSGLGLPMAKAIIEAHNGQISVTSSENLGSCFTLTLPLFSKIEDQKLHE